MVHCLKKVWFDKKRTQTSTEMGISNEMGTGQQLIICQVVALCSGRVVCWKGLCIN